MADRVTIPAALLEEIRADLAAGGDRARRWRQPSPHPVVVLARGEDAWPVGWVGTLADVTDHSGCVTAPGQPHPAAATAWAPVGDVDAGPRPDIGDRVLIRDVRYPDIEGAAIGQIATVDEIDNLTGRVSATLTDGRAVSYATKWATLPPEVPTGLGEQPTPGEASELGNAATPVMREGLATP